MTAESGALGPTVAVAHGRSVPLSGPWFPGRQFCPMVFEAGTQVRKNSTPGLSSCPAPLCDPQGVGMAAQAFVPDRSGSSASLCHLSASAL